MRIEKREIKNKEKEKRKMGNKNNDLEMEDIYLA